MNEVDEKNMQNQKKLMGSKTATLCEKPIHLVKEDRFWMWDANGKKYLDCYNNVLDLGHCHPKVFDVIHRQMLTLNTHTRYLHQGLLSYLERPLLPSKNRLNVAF